MRGRCPRTRRIPPSSSIISNAVGSVWNRSAWPAWKAMNHRHGPTAERTPTALRRPYGMKAAAYPRTDSGYVTQRRGHVAYSAAFPVRRRHADSRDARRGPPASRRGRIRSDGPRRGRQGRRPYGDPADAAVHPRRFFPCLCESCPCFGHVEDG